LRGQAWHDARAYVLYTALDEVKKTSVYLMRLRELLDETFDTEPDRISRLVHTQVREEQEARIRRLLEVLLTLILFEETNEQEYYRHLLLLEELEDLLSGNADLQEFYGERSANIDESIKRQITWIKSHEKKIDISRRWYLRTNPDYSRVGNIFSSIRYRVRLAIPKMTNNEKIIFGFSYAGYIAASDSIHYSVNRHDYRNQSGEEKRNVHGLGLTVIAILNRCHQLMGRPDVPPANKISSLLKKLDSADLVYSMTIRDINVGDFVLAYGDLGEVVEIRESDYGYRSYRVRYMAEKPMPNLQEDWFPARYVQRFYTRTQARENLKKMIAEGKIPREIGEQMGKLSDEELQSFLRESLLATWRHGFRDCVRERKSK
jgi:hypothetical protein